MVQLLRTLRRPHKKGAIPLIGRIIFLNKIAYIDLFLPFAGLKTLPSRMFHRARPLSKRKVLFRRRNKKGSIWISPYTAQTAGETGISFHCGSSHNHPSVMNAFFICVFSVPHAERKVKRTDTHPREFRIFHKPQAKKRKKTVTFLDAIPELCRPVNFSDTIAAS